MKILKGDEKIKNQLISKRERLEKIYSSELPTDPAKHKMHDEKVLRAARYMDELDAVMAEVLNSGLNIKLVPRPTFEKQIERADFATMEFDGEYCKVVVLSNYPFDNIWLIYTAPVESI